MSSPMDCTRTTCIVNVNLVVLAGLELEGLAPCWIEPPRQNLAYKSGKLPYSGQNNTGKPQEPSQPTWLLVPPHSSAIAAVLAGHTVYPGRHQLLKELWLPTDRMESFTYIFWRFPCGGRSLLSLAEGRTSAASGESDTPIIVPEEPEFSCQNHDVKALPNLEQVTYPFPHL